MKPRKSLKKQLSEDPEASARIEKRLEELKKENDGLFRLYNDAMKLSSVKPSPVRYEKKKIGK